MAVKIMGISNDMPIIFMEKQYYLQYILIASVMNFAVPLLNLSIFAANRSSDEL